MSLLKNKSLVKCSYSLLNACTNWLAVHVARFGLCLWPQFTNIFFAPYLPPQANPVNFSLYSHVCRRKMVEKCRPINFQRCIVFNFQRVWLNTLFPFVFRVWLNFQWTSKIVYHSLLLSTYGLVCAWRWSFGIPVFETFWKHTCRKSG